MKAKSELDTLISRARQEGARAERLRLIKYFEDSITTMRVMNRKEISADGLEIYHHKVTEAIGNALVLIKLLKEAGNYEPRP